MNIEKLTKEQEDFILEQDRENKCILDDIKRENSEWRYEHR